jgi:putative toxin-antitoxin system antitoxin component (TIGR02293 family)
MLAEVLNEDFYRDFRDRLSEFLNVPIGASDSNIHEMNNAGFSADRINIFCELGQISPQQRDQIIPYKPLSSRLTLGQKLTVDESDRLFRHAYITAMAEVLFGSREKASSWLSKPKDHFSGKSPIAMLSTKQGTHHVEQLLIQVAEGYAF